MRQAVIRRSIRCQSYCRKWIPGAAVTLGNQLAKRDAVGETSAWHASKSKCSLAIEAQPKSTRGRHGRGPSLQNGAPPGAGASPMAAQLAAYGHVRSSREEASARPMSRRSNFAMISLRRLGPLPASEQDASAISTSKLERQFGVPQAGLGLASRFDQDTFARQRIPGESMLGAPGAGADVPVHLHRHVLSRMRHELMAEMN